MSTYGKFKRISFVLCPSNAKHASPYLGWSFGALATAKHGKAIPNRHLPLAHLLKITAAEICLCICHSTLSNCVWAHPMTKNKAPQAPPMMVGSPKPKNAPPQSLFANRCPPHHPFPLLSRDLSMHSPQHPEQLCLGTPNGQG